MKQDPKYKFLRNRLLSDLSAVGVPVDLFELFIKDYSATYYGCYRTKTNRIYLYNYEDKELTVPYSYEHMVNTAIHEAVHALQWHDDSHIRVKGVMHDEQFYLMYNKYSEALKEVYNEKADTSITEGVLDLCKSTAHHSGESSEHYHTGAYPNTDNRILRVACRRRG